MKKLLFALLLAVWSSGCASTKSTPPPTSEVKCLAHVAYEESRASSRIDQIATAYVAVNRAKGKHWPSTICGVITERRYSPKYKKMMSAYPWYDGHSLPVPKSKKAWARSMKIAEGIISGKIKDPTNGATHNCAKWAYCSFAKNWKVYFESPEHNFYKGV